tara:strand:- start:721 stop:1059 length:339 start_codon:yes stop_codon:yes gene_type:complete
MKLEDEIYLELKRFALEKPSEESCGLLYRSSKGDKLSFHPCRNVHEDPGNFFEVSSSDYLQASEKGEIEASFHSHPKGGKLSEADLKMSKNLELSFLIYSIPENKFYYNGVN